MLVELKGVVLAALEIIVNQQDRECTKIPNHFPEPLFFKTICKWPQPNVSKLCVDNRVYSLVSRLDLNLCPQRSYTGELLHYLM